MLEKSFELRRGSSNRKSSYRESTVIWTIKKRDFHLIIHIFWQIFLYKHIYKYISIYKYIYIYIYIYKNYITHCNIKRDNHQVPNIATNTEFTDLWPCLKISCFHWKSGSSNLLVERIYSTSVLRTFVLAFVSSELLPKRRVFIKNRLTEI